VSDARAKIGYLEDEVRRLKKLLREAIDLAEEANGDPSSCSHIVPVGERLKELRKETRS
jgi:hypothetical protein